jgi:hypothetical protein
MKYAIHLLLGKVNESEVELYKGGGRRNSIRSHNTPKNKLSRRVAMEAEDRKGVET